MSADMLDYIIDSNHIDSIPPEDIKRVKDMVLAGHQGSGTQPPPGQR